MPPLLLFELHNFTDHTERPIFATQTNANGGNMRKTIWIYLALLAFPLLLSAQGGTSVQWLDWEKAVSRQQEDKKKILLYIKTSWCEVCQKLEKVTLNDSELASYLNDNFHLVMFDAESKEDLTYQNKVFRFVNKNVKSVTIGYHEFAAEMLRGNLSFPSIVFLNEKQEIIQSINGPRSSQEFQQIATYFAENHYKTTPWSAFQKLYKVNE